MTGSPLVDRLFGQGRPGDPAIEVPSGDGFLRLSYADLWAQAESIRSGLLSGHASLDGACVGFLAAPGELYVSALLGILRAGGLAVPMSPLHTPPELAHVVENASPHALLATRDLLPRLAGVARTARVIAIEELVATRATAAAAPKLSSTAPALMLYTSGTTGRPKGVVASHGAVAATCASLHDAWGWRRDDRLLHVLPLHHTHGVNVALLGALWAGATVQFVPFEARRIWTLFAQATVFMAVPTIYAKLMTAFFGATPDEQRAFRAAAQALRLATSGSAALPAALFESFRDASGQALLERYGMTEIGMALGNPIAGPRVAGSVGVPLPGVEVTLVGDGESPCATGEPGELRVRSPQMFTEYFRDPEATRAAFDGQGRFRTGDTGVRDARGVFTLLGRTAIDILKSGGYKLSALEIEDVLREHPAIAEVGVIGLPDATWGDRVTACVVLQPGQSLSLAELRDWAKERLAPYKAPRDLQILDVLPRNAMGKLQKGRLRELVAAREGLPS